MRHDPSIQFILAPQEARAKPPHWLEAVLDFIEKILAPVGRFLSWIAGFLPHAAYARILLWVVLAAGAATLLWAVVSRVRYGEWTLKLPLRTAAANFPEEDEEWAPEEAGARSWLEEADALAREGRFAEAIHHLLFRTIEDISRRRPNLVRPALTSRELAASTLVPGRARELFASIARLVEKSLFGGRTVNEGDWVKARTTYSDFVLPAAWRP